MAWSVGGPCVRWGLPRWLVLIRLFQTLACLVSAILNGFVLAYIYLHHLGLAQNMLALELMICVALIYSSLVLLVYHTGKQRLQPGTPVISSVIIGDVILTGLMIAIVTVLARAGVPSTCEGLVRDNRDLDTRLDDAQARWTAVRNTSDWLKEKRTMGRYCALERAYYFLTIAMIFSYMITVTLGALRIFERYYTKNSNVDDLLRTAGDVLELDNIRSKQNRPGRPADTEDQEHDAVSRGIMTPASIDIAATSSQAAVSPISTHHEPSNEHQTSSLPTVSPITPMTPNTPVGGPFTSNDMIENTDDTAAEATIADGYQHHRHNSPVSLPPYTPGPSQSQYMVGHGNESNEMRLSDYVKGQTRAQTMKDSGEGM
ncbi:hypothetical protein F4780DRAFT_459958 [Xylariomycetidae sp. FL0641]|nr:hypothetical protein F4780DRAFT_459958 [Xylariomycetidae sp. FL0641]